MVNKGMPGQDPVKEGGVEHQDKPHWTKPPPQDERLYRYFTGNDLEPGSMHGAFQHMAETSFARGVPDPDARMVNSGAVGFAQRDELELIERGNVDGRKRERVSKAQEHRETRAMLEQVPARCVVVLRLAYGPTDIIPALKLGANPQARAKLDGDEDKHGRTASRKSYAKRERLGAWRQLLPSTKAAQAAYEKWLQHAEAVVAEKCARHASAEAAVEDVAEVEVQLVQARRDEESAPLVSAERRAAAATVRRLEKQLETRLVMRRQPDAVNVTLEAWLINHATEREISAARVEANNMVREAWNLWADVRGRRRKSVWLNEPRDIR